MIMFSTMPESVRREHFVDVSCIRKIETAWKVGKHLRTVVSMADQYGKPLRRLDSFKIYIEASRHIL
jgi:hypothetical protein